MTGNGPGTVRATVLCAMALLAQQLGRDYHSLTGLCAALLVLLAANPYAAANAGLQFSFLSTLGILLFGQDVYKRQVSNCGEQAGQSVFHLHFHVLAGRDMTWPPG